jgi:hypothetical protein
MKMTLEKAIEMLMDDDNNGNWYEVTSTEELKECLLTAMECYEVGEDAYEFYNNIYKNIRGVSEMYNYYGIRTLRSDEEYKVGDYCRRSYDWDYENDCSSEEQLNGTCCTEVEINDIDDMNNIDISNHRYGKGTIVLIAGDEMERGTDSCELIIRNAIVVKIIAE